MICCVTLIIRVKNALSMIHLIEFAGQNGQGKI